MLIAKDYYLSHIFHSFLFNSQIITHDRPKFIQLLQTISYKKRDDEEEQVWVKLLHFAQMTELTCQTAVS